MKNYTFCIDLDGTLKTEVDFDCSDFENTITVELKKTYKMVPRNDIVDFLRAAKSKGKVFMTTGAMTSYGKKVAKALNIFDFFDEIIGADKMVKGQWPKFEGNVIWIDNDPDILKRKIAQLPSKLQYKTMDTWIIDTFIGVPDTTMKDLVEEIKKLS